MRAHHFLGIAAVIVLGFVLQQLLFGSPIAEAEMPAPQMDVMACNWTPSYGRHEGGPNTRQVDGVHRSRVMRWAKACDQGPRFLGRSDGIPTRSYAERARRLGAPCVSRSDARALSEVGRSSGGRPFLFRPSTNVANLRVLPSLACSGRAGGEEEFRCLNYNIAKQAHVDIALRTIFARAPRAASPCKARGAMPLQFVWVKSP